MYKWICVRFAKSLYDSSACYILWINKVYVIKWPSKANSDKIHLSVNNKEHNVSINNSIFEINERTVYRIIKNHKEEMINELTEILLIFPIKQINKLVDSMNNRVDAVYNNNFEFIDY